MSDAFRVNLYRKPFETDEYGVIDPEKTNVEVNVGVKKEDVGQNVDEKQTKYKKTRKNVGESDRFVGVNTPGTEYVVENVEVKLSASERRNRIVEMMKEDSSITSKQLSNMLLVTSRTIDRDIDKLKKQNRIRRQGDDKYGQWIVSE